MFGNYYAGQAEPLPVPRALRVLKASIAVRTTGGCYAVRRGPGSYTTHEVNGPFAPGERTTAL